MRFLRFVPTIMLVTIATTGSVNAQIDNVEVLFRGGVNDVNILVEEYLRPLGNGFGTDLNHGWYSSAKTHKVLGFDIMLLASAAFAPDADKTFDIADLALENLAPANPGSSQTPTLVGEDTEGPLLNVILTNPLTARREIVGSVRMPAGTGLSFVPAPMIQGSIGVFSGTDLMVRFLPEITISDFGKVKMSGFGIKHNVNSWLPGGALLPVDLAAMVAFTSLQAQSSIEVDPDPTALPSGATYDDQEVRLDASGFTFNVIASKTFALLTIFGSIGIEKSNLDIDLRGTYPITSIDNLGRQVVSDFTDPVSISYDGANKSRALLGAQLKLGVIMLHGTYAFSDYPVANVGAGLSIR